MPSSKQSDPKLDERLRLLAESYQRLTGKALIDDWLLPPCTGKAGMGIESVNSAVSTPTLTLPLQGGGNISTLREALWNAPFAIVAHGTEADPVFFYGNRYALDCFEMSFEEFAKLPSRLSAEPVNQEARERALKKVAERGYIDGYSGMRIASSGRRFMISDCTIWNIVDAAGVHHGQAAIFVAGN